MSLRALLVALIALATAGFVVGTTIERNKQSSETATQHAAETTPAPTETHAESGGESAGEAGGESSAKHSGESGASTAEAGSAHTERNAELKPVGIDIEAVPFVILAALASLGLALAAWLRPQATLLLLGVAGAMALFAILDVREVVHQSDENRTGLAVLAGAIALVHAAAAVAALTMAQRGQRSEPAAPSATMPA